MSDNDHLYTSKIRDKDPLYRYEIKYAPNGGVAIFDSFGRIEAAFSNCSSAAEWMEERLADFERETELAA